MRGLNLDHLRTFAEVVAAGSFSKAAVVLNITQPAVSLQIRNLERRFNVRLIERVGKRSLPTPAGRELLGFARQIEHQSDTAIAKMQGYQSPNAGRVRIGTGASACIYLLPEVLTSVRSHHPGIEIVVINGNTPELLDAVEQNTLDLALVTLPARRRSLSVREVLDDPLVAVFPPGEPLPARIRPAHFTGRPLILYEPGGAFRMLIEKWFAAARVAVKPVMELGNVEATKRFIAAGFGCSILPSMALAQEKASRGVLVRPLAPALSRKLGLVLRHDKVLDSASRAVLKAFAKIGQDKA